MFNQAGAAKALCKRQVCTQREPMKMKLFVFLITALVCMLHPAFAKEKHHETCSRECGDYIKWSYHADCETAGPSQWASMKEHGKIKFPSCNPLATGSQSPIDIDCANTLEGVSGNMVLDGERKYKVLNNGHTIQANIEKDQTKNPLTTTTNLPSRLEAMEPSPPSRLQKESDTIYKVAQFHIHWQKEGDDLAGSEHSINGNFSPMELHIVHYDSTKFNSLLEAINSDGVGNLLVIAVLFNLNDDPRAHNLMLQTFLQAFNGESSGKSKSNYKEEVVLDISHFIPQYYSNTSHGDLRGYFAYKGSLTTPPCNHNQKMPIVTWLVSRRNMSISSKQLEFLKKSIYTDNVERKTLISKYGNSRPIQCIGTRGIYYMDEEGSAIPRQCVRPLNDKCTITENSQKLYCEDTIFWHTTGGLVVILLIIFMSAALILSLAYLYLYKNKSCPSCLKSIKNMICGRDERLVTHVDSDLLNSLGNTPKFNPNGSSIQNEYRIL